MVTCCRAGNVNSFTNAGGIPTRTPRDQGLEWTCHHDWDLGGLLCVNRLVSSFRLETGCEAWRSELSNQGPLLPRAAGEDGSPVASIRPSPESVELTSAEATGCGTRPEALPRITTASLRAPGRPGQLCLGGWGSRKVTCPARRQANLNVTRNASRPGTPALSRRVASGAGAANRTGPFDVACTSPCDRSWMTYLFLLVHNFNRERKVLHRWQKVQSIPAQTSSQNQ